MTEVEVKGISVPKLTEKQTFHRPRNTERRETWLRFVSPFDEEGTAPAADPQRMEKNCGKAWRFTRAHIEEEDLRQGIAELSLETRQLHRGGDGVRRLWRNQGDRRECMVHCGFSKQKRNLYLIKI